MPGLPASPRLRRRLRAAAVAAVVLLAGVTLALLVPGKGQRSGAPTAPEGPANIAISTPKARLTRADRRAIDATLDRFIPAGMERRDAAGAWALAGPEMRADSTLAQWRAGTSPIPYYPARGTTFHDWQTIDVGPRYVIFNLLLHPKPSSKLPPYVFSGEVVKDGRRWLVNRLYTIAIMYQVTKTTHEIGPRDFAASGAASQGPTGRPVLGRAWILPALGIFGLILLVPLALGATALLRAHRWRRHVRSSDRSALPPLPSGYAASGEPRPPEKLSRP